MFQKLSSLKMLPSTFLPAIECCPNFLGAQKVKLFLPHFNFGEGEFTWGGGKNIFARFPLWGAKHRCCQKPSFWKESTYANDFCVNNLKLFCGRSKVMSDGVDKKNTDFLERPVNKSKQVVN